MEDQAFRWPGADLPVVRLLGLALAILPLLHVVTNIIREQRIKHIPFVSGSGNAGPGLRSILAYLLDAPSIVQKAYDQICRVPNVLSSSQIIVPVTLMDWMLRTPESTLGVREPQVDTLQPRWIFGHNSYVTRTWHPDILRESLRDRADSVMRDFQAGLAADVHTQLGVDEQQWREVTLDEAMKAIIFRGTARYMVGDPLCTSEEFIRSAVRFCDIAGPTSAVMQLLPNLLRPILGPLVSLPCYFITRNLKQQLRQTYEQRVQPSTSASTDKEPVDLLQDFIRYTSDRWPQDMNLHTMATQILLLFLAASVQTYVVATQALFHILDSNPEYDTIARIQEELRDVFGDDPSTATWSRGNASKLTYLDSVLRETLRLCPIVSFVMNRKVMADDVVTPDGVRIPRGETIAFSARSVQLDPSIYPEPHKFIPGRFVGSPKRFTTTGRDFLSLAHAQFGCPGRFVADLELKMTLAHILTCYDVELPKEYNGRRPPSTWYVDVMFAPRAGKIRVKRKGFTT